MHFFDSSDSEDDVDQFSSLSVSPPKKLKPYNYFQFVKELEPIPVYLFSMRDDVPLIPDYISLLTDNASTDHPFISVGSEWKHNVLDVLQLGTPSMCLVIQIHGITTLHQDIERLLTSTDMMKVFNGRRVDINRMKTLWRIEVGLSYDMNSYLHDIARVHTLKAGNSDIGGDLSRHLSTFASHGYTLLSTNRNAITISNWSSQILTKKQIEHASLDAFWIAIMYQLMVSSEISVQKNSIDCVFFTNKLSSEVPEHPFETTPLLSTHSTSWLNSLSPFCCDIHNVPEILEKRLSKLDQVVELSESLYSFASVLFNILSHPLNSSSFECLQPSQDFSFFFDQRDFTTSSIVNLCVRILLPLLFNDLLSSFTAMKFPQKYPMYILSVVYNLLALVVDSLSVPTVQQLTVTKEMMSCQVSSDFVDDSVLQLLPFIWGKTPKLYPICIDLPRIKVLNITACSSNSEAAINTFLKSISATNPRVTVLARSVVKVIDQIILASDNVILNFDVGMDHVFPSLLLDLFSNDVISKDFFGLSCTPQDVADFFFLTDFTNVVDRTIPASSAVDLINTPLSQGTNNWSKFATLITSEFHLFPVISSLESVISLTAILHYFFKNDWLLLPSRSFSINVSKPLYLHSDALVLVRKHHSLMQKYKALSVIPSYCVSNQKNSNPGNVVHQIDCLGLSVLATDLHHSIKSIRINFTVDDKNLNPLIEQSLKLFKRFNMCNDVNLQKKINDKPTKFKLSFSSLDQLFALERLFAKDITFREDLRALSFGLLNVHSANPKFQMVKKKKVASKETRPSKKKKKTKKAQKES
ncbi:hypothetical protein GEMRC1_013738 [Eukaryota sp. GEM-RC1]